MIKRIVLFLFLILIIFFSFSFFDKTFKNDIDEKKFVFWSIQLKPIFEEQIKELISNFEKRHPDYRVVWIDIPIQEAQKRTLASILSSAPPDLINLNPEFSQVLARKNALEYFDENDVSDIHSGLVNKLKYKDKIYAVPFYATSPITIYNKEIFDKCNEGKAVKSYDELFETSPKIYSCSKVSPFAINLNEGDSLYKILKKYDIDKFITNKEYDKVVYLFSKFDEMYKKGYVPQDTLNVNHREVIEKYMSQQAALIVTGSNFIKTIKENAYDVYNKSQISSQLVGDNLKYDVALMNLVIPVKSKNKEMAKEFIQMLTDEQIQLKLAKVTNVLPANKYALEDEYFKNCSSDIEDNARCVAALQLNNLIFNDNEINDKKAFNEIINKTLEEILLNNNSDFELIKTGVTDLFSRLNLFIVKN